MIVIKSIEKIFFVLVGVLIFLINEGLKKCGKQILHCLTIQSVNENTAIDFWDHFHCYNKLVCQ